MITLMSTYAPLHIREHESMNTPAWVWVPYLHTNSMRKCVWYLSWVHIQRCEYMNIVVHVGMTIQYTWIYVCEENLLLLSLQYSVCKIWPYTCIHTWGSMFQIRICIYIYILAPMCSRLIFLYHFTCLSKNQISKRMFLLEERASWTTKILRKNGYSVRKNGYSVRHFWIPSIFLPCTVPMYVPMYVGTM